MGEGRLVIAGTHSGVGKTSIAVGLMAALRGAGLLVQPFKIGPDYLDPGFHTLAAGRPSWSLDTWMLGSAGVRESFARGAHGAEIAIIEGMMGLYDGANPTNEIGSTAEVAKLLEAPVILVIDASGLARSAGALVQGYRDYDPAVKLAGVIANRAAGEGHLKYLRPAIEEELGLPLLGGLPEEESIHLPQRHLGLIAAGEDPGYIETIAQLGVWTRKHLNLPKILEIAHCQAHALLQHPTGADRTLPTQPAAPQLNDSIITRSRSSAPNRKIKPGVRIAVAQDAAFCFYYPDNLLLLEEAGAELIPFSPLRDEELPPHIQGLYLGGGYPELHAMTLARNVKMRASVNSAITHGLATFAECGGFMYLCESLVTADNIEYPMAGVIPGRTVMESRLQAIGYREVILCQETVLGHAGETARGHEFRYSRCEGSFPDDQAALELGEHRVGCGTDRVGCATPSLLASYIHLHFGSNPRLAASFVEKCRQGRG